MAINAENENLVSLTEATKVLPRINGRKPAVSTLWRWCRVGLRGVHLDYLRMGRRIVTSRQALHRFFTELAETDEILAGYPSVKPERFQHRGITAKARQRALEEAEAVRAKAGI
jgi:hypothetical protein